MLTSRLSACVHGSLGFLGFGVAVGSIFRFSGAVEWLHGCVFCLSLLGGACLCFFLEEFGLCLHLHEGLGWC